MGGVREFDCWGLTCAVREEVLQLPALPDFGLVSRLSLRESARAYQRYAEHLPAGPPVHGAIAAVLSAHLCTHVGLVLEIDGRLGVLEINPGESPRWMPVLDFERLYYRVVYHRDRDLPEQTQ
ncbi:hypothetical protein D9M71_402600 [compost metagenome]